VIAFTLPTAMDVTLTVFDVTGKMVWRIDGSYTQGRNEIQLKATDLKTSGVYYYQLLAGDFTASKALVLAR
jgi:hypothetical protein